MNPRVLLVISIFLLASCGLGLSEKDKASVKTIVDTWGGQCSYSKSASVSSEKGKRKTFELTLENSPALESNIPKETITSNMALTIYKGWTEEQRNSYTHVSATLKQNGNTYEDEYSVAQLKVVSEKEALFYRYADDIKQHNFTGIMKHMDPIYYNDSSIVVLKEMADYEDSLYGPVLSSRLLGFQFIEKEISGQRLHLLRLHGNLERPKGKVRFLLGIDPAKKMDEYYLYSLTF